MISLSDAFSKTAKLFRIRNFGKTMEKLREQNWIVLDEHFPFDRIDILNHLIFEGGKFIKGLIQFEGQDFQYLYELYCQVLGVTEERFEQMFFGTDFNFSAHFKDEIEFNQGVVGEQQSVEQPIEQQLFRLQILESLFLTNPDKIFDSQEAFDQIFLIPSLNIISFAIFNTQYEINQSFLYLQSQKNLQYLVLRNLNLHKISSEFGLFLNYLVESKMVLELIDISYSDLKTSDFENFTFNTKCLILLSLDINPILSVDLTPLQSNYCQLFTDQFDSYLKLSEIYQFLLQFLSGKQLAELKEMKTNELVLSIQRSFYCEKVEIEPGISPVLCSLLNLLLINNKKTSRSDLQQLQKMLRKLEAGHVTSQDLLLHRKYMEVNPERPIQVKMVRKSHSCRTNVDQTKLQNFMNFESAAIGKKGIKKPTIIDFKIEEEPMTVIPNRKIQKDTTNKLSKQLPRKCAPSIEQTEDIIIRAKSSQNKIKKQLADVDRNFNMVYPVLCKIFFNDLEKIEVFYQGNKQKIGYICQMKRKNPDLKLLDLFNSKFK